MNEQISRTTGLTFLDALTLLFVGLKLTGAIDWSWWFVLAPVYAPFLIGVLYGVYQHIRS